MPSPILAGDPNDTDAETIDSLYRDKATPPAAKDLPTVFVTAPAKPKPMTRLLTGTLGIQAAWSPTLILPADSARISLRLRFYSPTATDFIRIADDAGKVYSLGGSCSLYPNDIYLNESCHTGPLWAYGPEITSAAAMLCYTATTV